MNTIEKFKKNWGLLSGLALFLMGVISSFLIDPPSYVMENAVFVNWGRFVAAIVAGLVLVGLVLFKAKKHTVRWWSAAAMMLVLSVGSFFLYQHLRQRWTCTCFSPDKPILIGNVLKNPHVEYVIQNQNDCKKLLMGGQCDPEAVWTKQSIDNNRLVLVALYTLTIPFLIIAMMAVVQAVFCAQQKR